MQDAAVMTKARNMPLAIVLEVTIIVWVFVYRMYEKKQKRYLL